MLHFINTDTHTHSAQKELSSPAHHHHHQNHSRKISVRSIFQNNINFFFISSFNQFVLFVWYERVWFFGRDTSLNTFHVFHTHRMYVIHVCMYIHIQKKMHLYLSFTWNFNANTFLKHYLMHLHLLICIYTPNIRLECRKITIFSMEYPTKISKLSTKPYYLHHRKFVTAFVWFETIYVFFCNILKCQLKLAATKRQIFDFFKKREKISIE